MIKDTKFEIKSPKVNQVVFFKPWQGKDAKKKAYPVIIIDGQYMGTYGLSNFWDYQRVSPTGKINKNIEHCYGNFTKAEGFAVKIVIETLVLEETTTKIEHEITVF